MKREKIQYGDGSGWLIEGSKVYALNTQGEPAGEDLNYNPDKVREWGREGGATFTEEIVERVNVVKTTAIVFDGNVITLAEARKLRDELNTALQETTADLPMLIIDKFGDRWMRFGEKNAYRRVYWGQGESLSEKELEREYGPFDLKVY